jgi:hypothetical protein
MAFDTEKLHAILAAAQNPAFKKLIDERTKKLEERAKIDAEIADLDGKIAGTIPPELLALLTPPQPAEPAKTRKRKVSAEEPQAEKMEAPTSLPAEVKPQAEIQPEAA